MPDCSEVDILTVTTTVGSLEEAKRLARGLVEARLAACVQVEPVTASFYRWEGKLCEGAEQRLTIKTLPSRAGAMQAFFREHHPYDVPQFVMLPARASEAYGNWVRDEVA